MRTTNELQKINELRKLLEKAGLTVENDGRLWVLDGELGFDLNESGEFSVLDVDGVPENETRDLDDIAWSLKNGRLARRIAAA